MDITGISDVRFLDYRDSGMEGWDDNNHPNAYCNASAETVVERLRGIIAEVNAHVVITHDPTGGYGHPDHKTMCAHATAAAERASDPDAATPLLYYVCFPRSVFQRLWQEMTDRGITPPFAVDAVDTLGTPDERGDDHAGHLTLGRYEDRVTVLPPHPDQQRRPLRATAAGGDASTDGDGVLSAGPPDGGDGFAGRALTTVEIRNDNAAEFHPGHGQVHRGGFSTSANARKTTPISE